MNNTTRHTLKPFDIALEEMQNHILTMASLTTENLEKAIKGMMERDDKLCREVKKADDGVDELEMTIDVDAQRILTQFSPVASDLRIVITTMKVSGSLERISDYAVNISKRVLKMNGAPEVPEMRLIEPIYEKALRILADSLEAFRRRDRKLALSLGDRDKELDREHKAYTNAMAKRMQTDPDNLKTYLDLMFISRFLERVGDQAVNIGEDAVFLESAEDIRHQ